MTPIKKHLEERAKYLLAIIQKKEVDVAHAPKGTLRVSEHGKYVQYYLRETPQDKNGRYLRVDEKDLTCQLGQKEYDSKVLKAAKDELRAIEAYLSRVPSTKMEDVYEQLRIGRKELVIPVAVTDEVFVKEWEAVEYQRRAISNGTPKYLTSKGEWVRSKSEWMIAELLKDQGVPYRYEYPLHLPSYGTVCPDFCVLNVRTRQEYFWEHFGMLDDAEYAESTVRKISTYGENGLFLGKNLICTCETKNQGLNVGLAEQMIEQYLK